MITCTLTTHAPTTVSPSIILLPTSTTKLTPRIQGPTTATRLQDRLVSGFGTTTVFHSYLPWSLTTVEWLGGASKSSNIVIGRGFGAPEPPSGIHNYCQHKSRCAPSTPREACKPCEGCEAPHESSAPLRGRKERPWIAENTRSGPTGISDQLVGGWTGKKDLLLLPLCLDLELELELDGGNTRCERHAGREQADAYSVREMACCERRESHGTLLDDRTPHWPTPYWTTNCRPTT